MEYSGLSSLRQQCPRVLLEAVKGVRIDKAQLWSESQEQCDSLTETQAFRWRGADVQMRRGEGHAGMSCVQERVWALTLAGAAQAASRRARCPRGRQRDRTETRQA
eukprot:4114890-Prymnesium_polylepis.2